MNFKEEIKQILQKRKEQNRKLTRFLKLSSGQRLKRLQKEKQIQNVLDLLD